MFQTHWDSLLIKTHLKGRQLQKSRGTVSGIPEDIILENVKSHVGKTRNSESQPAWDRDIVSLLGTEVWDTSEVFLELQRPMVVAL